VPRKFSGFGQLIEEWQAHGGAVNTSTSPNVQYTYTEAASANNSRLTSITYPGLGNVADFEGTVLGEIDGKPSKGEFKEEPEQQKKDK
jgi:hypothetical protein